MGKRQGPNGAEAFRDYYLKLFGERWPSLETALAAEPDSVAFRSAPGLEPYYLDSASIVAASCLAILDEGRVLDACAAPGGKSLVLASRLGPRACLVANELSSDRGRRLRGVLDRHLSTTMRPRVEVWRRDAAAMCRGSEEAFDAILLDAPCSSERHVLSQAKARGGDAALEAWSPARIRGLAVRQWALLSSALIMLKSGGSLVYSTCALSPDENDRVVARASAKLGSRLVMEGIPPEASALLPSIRAEATDYGAMIMPDRSRGAGPLYICVMKKLG